MECGVNEPLTLGCAADVAAPSDFELPYEPLELKTSDDIMLRCYLLPQRKDAGAGEAFLDIPAGMSEDEVRGYLGLSRVAGRVLNRGRANSSSRAGRR